jgi:hypothetical protein
MCYCVYFNPGYMVGGKNKKCVGYFPIGIHFWEVKKIVKNLLETSTEKNHPRHACRCKCRFCLYVGLCCRRAGIHEVKFCTVLVLLLVRCSFLLLSKLQSEIKMLTLEAEFITLSTGMQDLISAKLILHKPWKKLYRLLFQKELVYNLIF